MPPLTTAELRQVLYDLMPDSWHTKFLTASKVLHEMTIPQVVAYFRIQENLAVQREAKILKKRAIRMQYLTEGLE